MLRFIKSHKKGIIGTVAFHALIVLLFVLFGFSTPLPLPAEKGIMINFGNMEDAAGQTELEQSRTEQPARSEPQTRQEPQPQQEQQQQDQPEAQPAAQEGEEVQTQDFEEAPAVEEQTRQQEEQKKQTTQQETQPQEEQKKQEEKKKVEQQPEREVNTKALYPGRSTEESGESEGETQGEGNQGRESGTPYSDNHANLDSKGMGGIDFSLEGRNPESLPKPEYNYQVEGKVVVEITVDKYGNVTKAEAGMKGSTTLNDKLLRAARKAALNAKFDPKPDAPAYQKGTITYYFRLQ